MSRCVGLCMTLRHSIPWATWLTWLDDIFEPSANDLDCLPLHWKLLIAWLPIEEFWLMKACVTLVNFCGTKAMGAHERLRLRARTRKTKNGPMSKFDLGSLIKGRRHDVDTSFIQRIHRFVLVDVEVFLPVSSSLSSILNLKRSKYGSFSSLISHLGLCHQWWPRSGPGPHPQTRPSCRSPRLTSRQTQLQPPWTYIDL